MRAVTHTLFVPIGRIFALALTVVLSVPGLALAQDKHVYACTPLVRIPVAALQNGARVRGETIGELGYGNTPLDMIDYVDAADGKEYLLVTHNSRNATMDLGFCSWPRSIRSRRMSGR
jgi:hypothetical protein